MAVFVHPRFDKVEAGFVVLLVASEFLFDVVVCRLIGGDGGSAADVRVEMFAEREEIAAGNDVALGIGHHPRRAEMVFGPIPSLLIWDCGLGISDFPPSR